MAGGREQGNDAVRFVRQIMLFLFQVGRQGRRNRASDGVVHSLNTREQTFLGFRFFGWIGNTDGKRDGIDRGSMKAGHLEGQVGC